MYLFEHAGLPDQPLDVSSDYMALSHGGHGINSYALTYHLVYRPLVITFQVGWGGAYMDGTAEADLFKQQCELSAGLVELSSRVRAAHGLRAEMGLVQVSDFRGVCDFLIVDSGGHHQRVHPRKNLPFHEAVSSAYEQAGKWLDAQL